jgi:hypothetical protein
MGNLEDKLMQNPMVPTSVEVVTLKKNEVALMGAAAVFLAIFLLGLLVEVAKGEIGLAMMLSGIFFCVVVQGMRR